MDTISELSEIKKAKWKIKSTFTSNGIQNSINGKWVLSNRINGIFIWKHYNSQNITNILLLQRQNNNGRRLIYTLYSLGFC